MSLPIPHPPIHLRVHLFISSAHLLLSLLYPCPSPTNLSHLSTHPPVHPRNLLSASICLSPSHPPSCPPIYPHLSFPSPSIQLHAQPPPVPLPAYPPTSLFPVHTSSICLLNIPAPQCCRPPPPCSGDMLETQWSAQSQSCHQPTLERRGQN